MIIDPAVKFELPLDLKMGKKCSSIPHRDLSAEELAKVYAYYVLQYGSDHVICRDVLDSISEFSSRYLHYEVEDLQAEVKTLKDEIGDLEDAIDDLEN